MPKLGLGLGLNRWRIPIAQSGVDPRIQAVIDAGGVFYSDARLANGASPGVNSPLTTLTDLVGGNTLQMIGFGATVTDGYTETTPNEVATDGVDSVVKFLTDNGLDITDAPLAFAITTKIDSTTPNGYPLMRNDNSLATSQYGVLFDNSNDNLRFYLEGDVRTSYIATSDLNTWANFVFYWDGANASIYRNSNPTPVASTSYSVPLLTSRPNTQLGARSASNDGNTFAFFIKENWGTKTIYRPTSLQDVLDAEALLSADYLALNFNQPEPEPAPLESSNIVFIGASIMQGAYGRDLTTRNETATSEFIAKGLNVNVYGYGWSGYKLSNILSKVQEAFTTFPTDTTFIIHIGGNDVSATRPYSSMTTQELQDFNDDLDALFTTIQPRINDCVVANLTFRSYGDPATDRTIFNDESLGSKPYNDNLYKPRLDTNLLSNQNTDGNPIMDLYNWVRNNFETVLSTDGIHFTSSGNIALRSYMADRLDWFVNGKAKPSPITPDPVD